VSYYTHSQRKYLRAYLLDSRLKISDNRDENFRTTPRNGVKNPYGLAKLVGRAGNSLVLFVKVNPIKLLDKACQPE